MSSTIYTGNYKVVDSNVIFLYDLSSDMEVNLELDKEHNYKIIFKFIDDAEKTGLTREIKKNTIIFECINFSDNGTGSNSPIDIIEVDGKKLIIHFWMSKPLETIRKFEYTILIER